MFTQEEINTLTCPISVEETESVDKKAQTISLMNSTKHLRNNTNSTQIFLEN